MRRGERDGVGDATAANEFNLRLSRSRIQVSTREEGEMEVARSGLGNGNNWVIIMVPDGAAACHLP